MIADDVGTLAQKLADNDLAELDKLGVPAFHALKEGYVIGSYCGLVDGVPEAAFGLNRRVYPAAIWFLGSSRSRKHVRDFMSISRRWVAMMNRDVAVANIVPADNHTTIAWLKALDFEFDDRVYNINGHAFRRFRRGPLTTDLPH